MIGLLENQMLDRLRSGEPVIGYQWRTLETYPADWDVYFKDKTQINDPAAWVGFASTRTQDYEDNVVRVEGVFGLIVVASNRRNERARRHGEAGQIGSYQLMTDALSLLVGFAPEAAVGPITAGRVRHVRPDAFLNQNKASMMAAELFVSFQVPLLPHDLTSTALANFATFHANWDIAPFGGVDANLNLDGVQLPADAAADATDHVELEQ